MSPESPPPPADDNPWVKAGRWATFLGRHAGRAVAAGYRAIDPDLRQHIALTPLMGLTQLGRGDRTASAKPRDGHRPLLFVHGLAGQPGNFVGVRSYFRLRGRERQYAFPLASGSIETMGKGLALRIREVLEINRLGSSAQVDLVAHSMGGIVSRLALLDPQVAASVRSLVTLGTPHGGTWIARYADTHITRALRPQSATLEALEAQLPWGSLPGYPSLFAFWSRADILLIPHESARVEGAMNVEVARSSHFGYLLRPSVWEQIYELLHG